MPASNSVLTSNFKSGKSKNRGSGGDDGSLHSHAREVPDTQTREIYSRFTKEREDKRKLLDQIKKNSRKSLNSMPTIEDAKVKSSGQSPKVLQDGETSQEDDQQFEQDNEEYFQEPDPLPPQTASDGKILFSHKSTFIQWWSNMVIILAMYNSVTIPMAIFYEGDGPSMIQSEMITVIDALVDLTFLIDVILTFRTTYLDTDKGVDETDTHKIAKRYLNGSFTIDFASSVPFASFVPDSQPQIQKIFNLLGLLKLLRISRLSAALMSSNMDQGVKVYMKILMMAFQLLVVMHVLGAVWFYLVITAQRWVQNMDFMYNYQEDAYQGYFEGDENFIRKYLVMMYTAFYVFTVGEIVPRASTNEFMYSFLLESVCTIVNAIIIGYMTTYMDELGKKAQALSESINLTNTAMINLGLSRPLKTQISKYIFNTHTTKGLIKDMGVFLGDLKLSLREDVTASSFVSIASLNYVLLAVLKEKTEDIMTKSVTMQKSKMKTQEIKLKEKLRSYLVKEFTYIATKPDDDFVKQYGEPNEDPQQEEGGDDDEGAVRQRFMYFIRMGEFVVDIESNFNVGNDPSQEPQKESKRLYDGDHFGEIGLIYGLKRTATVKSANYGSLACLTWSGFEELQKEFPGLKTHFKNYIFKYNDPLRAFLEMEMDKITYFKILNMQTKQALLYNMERHTYEEGDTIFKQGRPIDRLIVIQSGVVQLSTPYDRRTGDENFVIERLTTGAVLNHQSFLMQLTAETEYICRTPVSCFELSYERFEQVRRDKNTPDLKMAKDELQEDLFKKDKQPLALDYVFHNNASNPEDFAVQLKKNEQRVKLKNAIMQVWTKIKKENQPKNLKTVMQERRDLEAKKNARLGLATKEDVEEDQRSESEKIHAESQTSYFTLDQYQTLNKRITDAHYRMREQQVVIDRLEKSMSSMTHEIPSKRQK